MSNNKIVQDLKTATMSNNQNIQKLTNEIRDSNQFTHQAFAKMEGHIDYPVAKLNIIEEEELQILHIWTP
jgi:hypothetical protein